MKNDAKDKEFSTQADISSICKELGSEEKILMKGDNIVGLKLLLSAGFAGKVDLVYIDPPSAKNLKYAKVALKTEPTASSQPSAALYKNTMLESKFFKILRQRLILIRELMSESASIYLHTDYKIGHYIKVMMDEIFGMENFKNDITRIKCNPKNSSRNAYGNIKDMILFYTKSSDAIWNNPSDCMDDDEIKRKFGKIDPNGRRYTTVPIHASGETKHGKTGEAWRGSLPPIGSHWRCAPSELDRLDKSGLIEWSNTGNPRKIVYADECIKSGKRKQDIWEYKDSRCHQYEKNEEMLMDIIRASSNEGSLVLDCFCGSGNTLLAAETLNRNWIGIDNSDIAIEMTENKLKEHRELDLFSLTSKPYFKITL